MSHVNKERPTPPEISPYVLPLVLAVMGVWCLYDGGFSSNPDMQEHIVFNRLASVALLIGAIASFFRIRHVEKQDNQEATPKKIPQWMMISNRRLILPYSLPFLIYVFFASVFKNHIPIELNYILSMIVYLSALVWAWKWYIPVTGPKSSFTSVILGIAAGVVGAFIWIIMLIPFSNPIDNEVWTDAAFILRVLAAGFLVPVFEEIFIRGFVFRLAFQWGEARILKEDAPLQIVLDEKSINDVRPGAWSWIAVVVSSIVFASGHHMYEWPASIAFSLFMTLLLIIRRDLVVCIVAHGVTNISLAFYVLTTNSWHLW